jgi:hypothetical protein
MLNRFSLLIPRNKKMIYALAWNKKKKRFKRTRGENLKDQKLEEKC